MSDGPRCNAAQSNNPDGTIRHEDKGLYPIWCAREAGHKGWHSSKDGFGWPPAPASEASQAP